MKVPKRDFLLVVFLLIIGVGLVGITYSEGESSVSIFLRIATMLILVYCVKKGAREQFVLNPFYMFALVPLSLMLYSEKVSMFYLNKLRPDIWFLGVINMLAFLLGVNCIKATNLKNRYTSFMKMKGKGEYKVFDSFDSSKMLCIHSSVLMIIGRIPSIASRMGGSIPFGSILSFCTFASIACAMASKNKWCIAGISLINILFVITGKPNKTGLLFLVLSYFGAYERFYVHNKKDRKRLVYIVVGIGLFFIFVAFPLKDFITSGGSVLEFGSYDKNSTVNYYSSRINWTGNSVLMMPYMYLVSAWNNVQYIVDTQNVRTYGLFFLKPLLGYLQMDDLFAKFYELRPYSSFNTYTYIIVLYKDFGYWGSAIGSLFLGLFVGLIYRKKYCYSESAFDVICYSLTAMATFEMFFSNHFLQLSYPFTIIILMWIYKVTVKNIALRRRAE